VPGLECLEGRFCPSGGYLLVGSFDTNAVLRYDENTGAFVDQFDPQNLANLKNPVGGVFGSDGSLYVSSGIFLKHNQKVPQYNGTTGAFQSVFASQNITSPRGVLVGPDGDLYVLDGNDTSSGDPASVERFDGKTVAFLNYFVAPGSGGLTHPSYMVFGPDGGNDGKPDLYVAVAAEKEGSSPNVGEILRYDGTTGASLGTFVAPNSGGLNAPAGLAFGADGDLYVANANWWTGPEVFHTGDFPAGAVLRFDGKTGAFKGTFVAGGTGGLANPSGLLFGPDGDLFVTSGVQSGNGGGLIAEPGTSQVLRYDGTSGAFLGGFVAPDSGGLKFPTFLTFTETNPTTLDYDPPGAPAGVFAAPATQAAFATNLAPLASSSLDMRQPVLPAAPLPGPVSPSTAPASQSGILPTPGASSPAPAGATDAVFAPFHVMGNDDDAWLFLPLLSGGPDGI
jgi:DNA-binding beta-propeller fold protein YncE